METSKILEAANAAKKAGASRFCMGAAWRSLHDRDVEKFVILLMKLKNWSGNLHDTRHVNRKPKQEIKRSGIRLLQSQY